MPAKKTKPKTKEVDNPYAIPDNKVPTWVKTPPDQEKKLPSGLLLDIWEDKQFVIIRRPDWEDDEGKKPGKSMKLTFDDVSTMLSHFEFDDEDEDSDDDDTEDEE